MILEKKRKSDNSFAASSFFANNGVNGYGTVTHREILYYDNDHLGTPQRLIDPTGNVRWQANQDAWGKEVGDQESEIRDQVRNGINSGYVEQPLRFQGQYYDEETGLHYNRYRYYDPHSGRYLSQDPVGIDGGANLYGYAANDPVNFIDPSGLEWQFSVGVSGSIGGLMIGGPFVGGGVSFGFTSSGTVFGQVTANAQVGYGVFAGIGFTGGASYSACPMELGLKTEQQSIGTFNIGKGVSGGVSVEGTESGITGASGGYGRIGAGFGVQTSVGASTTTTYAIRPW
jgi:RHS repeat-associated protein